MLSRSSCSLHEPARACSRSRSPDFNSALVLLRRLGGQARVSSEPTRAVRQMSITRSQRSRRASRSELTPW